MGMPAVQTAEMTKRLNEAEPTMVNEPSGPTTMLDLGGCHGGARYVRRARGWCAHSVRTVVPPPGASCPEPSVRTARRRRVRVARTCSTQAPSWASVSAWDDAYSVGTVRGGPGQAALCLWYVQH